MSHLLMRRPDLENLPAVPELPEGYLLRPYRDTDLTSLSVLLQKAFEVPQWTPERVRETLAELPDVKAMYVIDLGGEVVATASARLLPDVFPDSGYVHWVAVLPEHHGQQLGFAVVVAVLQQFVHLGCKDAVLETQDARLEAIQLYQGLGFVPVHTHPSHPERWGKIVDMLAAIGL